MRWLWGVCLIGVSFCDALYGQLTPEQKQLNTASFERVWTAVRDKHWEKNPAGLDWQAIHEEFRPKMDQASTMDQARAVMREMLSRLKQTHFGIFPSSLYADVTMEGGDGSTGIDVRVLDGQAIVTRVDANSPAERAGVKPGWLIVRSRDQDLAPIIEKLRADPAVHELQLERAVRARVTGPAGFKIRIVFKDGADQTVPLDMTLAPERGVLAGFGNFPPMHVWFESKRLGDTGYVSFNWFLDVVRLMNSFGDAVSGCAKCDGLIIDLRGNPGGIGAMAMGLAGWLVDKPNQRLGKMYLRDVTLNFVILPRPVAFTGPVAILVDGTSASTSEIFAEGLKDLGRARVFGEHTAAAALPSIFERLPNGDGFQYATANYISEGGQPLEGIGVTPDVEVKPTRQALLAGHDPALDAALEWIRNRRISP